MSTLPVYNQSLPHLCKIPGGLAHGVMIRIRGHIAQFVSRFIEINVQTGPALHPRDDVNLHLSIRLDQHLIVRNHLKNGCWGTEERGGGCPIVRGQFVEVLILAQSNCFKVAINGKHFCEFNHRLPLSAAQFIHIDGEMRIESITMGGDAPPSAPPMPLPTPYNPNQVTTEIVYNTPSYQPMHQQIMPTPPYMPTHHSHHHHSGGYQPPSYPYPSLQTPNLPPYQSSTVPPYQSPTNYPSHSHYPSYPSSGQSFHTPYGNQNSAYGTQTTQPYYQSSTYYQQPTVTTTKPPSNNTALKYAAGIGGIGLGAYVLSKAFLSDSDSD